MTTINDSNDSTPESRAEAESLITDAVRRELAAALAKLHVERDRAQRLEVQRDDLLAEIERVDDLLPRTVDRMPSVADSVRAALAESERLRNASIAAENGARNRVAELHADLRHIAKLAGVRVDGLGDSVLAQRATIAVTQIVEGLAASRGYCDSLDSKLTAVRNELTAAGVPDDQDVDGRRCALSAPERVEMLRAERDEAIVGRVAVLTSRDATIAESTRSIASLESQLDRARDELNAFRADERIAAHGPLRAEVAKLRARPVLTEERLDAAMTSVGYSAAVLPGIAAQLFKQLGTVVLPAQDRAEELAVLISTGMMAAIDEDGPVSADVLAPIVSRALDKLGASEVTLAPIHPEPSVQPPEVDSLSILCHEVIAWGEARARDRRADARLGEFRARLARMEADLDATSPVISLSELAVTIERMQGPPCKTLREWVIRLIEDSKRTPSFTRDNFITALAKAVELYPDTWTVAAVSDEELEFVRRKPVNESAGDYLAGIRAVRERLRIATITPEDVVDEYLVASQGAASEMRALLTTIMTSAIAAVASKAGQRPAT